MKRPAPVKGGECMGCLEIKPLLMPVPVIPGWPLVVWHMLCLDCRVNARSEGDWYALGWDWEHSRLRKMREAWREWLPKEEV